METPVALFIYKRPDLTEKVFAEIAAAKPKRLLVVADGPKTDEEAVLCTAARTLIDRVDWDCSVSREYSDSNLGCKKRVSSGLDWVFQQCDEAIILEDDVLPDPSFFPFCEELLQRFRHNERVLMIGGLNLQFGHNATPYSYYFSFYTHIWGWASWKRAWKHYDVNMSSWPSRRDTIWLQDLLGHEEPVSYWRGIFDRVHRGEIDTWDYQWLFTCWSQHAYSVIPAVNLIRNIGFTESATHTHSGTHALANLQRSKMDFPLNHPALLTHHAAADQYTFEQFFSEKESESKNPLHRIRQKLSRILR